ncbi:MAG TPA: sigma-54 dependent transcriptional regulator [Candidatus Sumerlaeota bacterium]|nr:sigma-54 dependent transcriptional regulator [Candidatus Sumerlaeota bacterium]HPK03587.1 sigma-54 dependent transcriptional regulator [Candidatus Sumerlaeota bacterium]
MVPQTATPNRGRVVIFDDEPSMGRILVKTLGLEGFEARSFTNPVEGFEALNELQPDVLLTDVRMPEMDGLTVLERMRRQYPDVPVLIITAYGTVEGAVAAMQAGAFNYITKPFEQANLVAQISKALEHRRVVQENERLSEQLAGQGQAREILGNSPQIARVRDMIARAAPTDSSVLITGPSGVGKELVAQAIHAQSRRAGGRFVAINCPSVPPSLIESEMFGYERGAFTGADRSKMGLVELAQGGTLFLDEVAELPAEMQVKLLRVIQEREIQRVGGLRQIPVDLRLIAATNRDLDEEMAAGRFREDLYYRLNVIHIEIPALSERPEDVPLLAERFMERIGRRMLRPDLRLSREALEALRQYHWPGNVRELENVIERAIVLTTGQEIRPEDLTIDLRRRELAAEEGAVAGGPAGIAWPIDYRAARDMFERQYLRNLVEYAGGNISHAAHVSGISRRNLYDKLERVGLDEELVRKR